MFLHPNKYFDSPPLLLVITPRIFEFQENLSTRLRILLRFQRHPWNAGPYLQRCDVRQLRPTHLRHVSLQLAPILLQAAIRQVRACVIPRYQAQHRVHLREKVSLRQLRVGKVSLRQLRVGKVLAQRRELIQQLNVLE
jgi:hypothetical protein